METSTLAAIILLLAANAAVESRSSGKLAHSEVSPQWQLHGWLESRRDEDLTECLKSWGFENDGYSNLEGYMFQYNDLEGKDRCKFVCYAQKERVLVDGKFVKEELIAGAAMNLGKEKATKIGNECEKNIAQEKPGDECAMSLAILECAATVAEFVHLKLHEDMFGDLVTHPY